LVVRVLGMRLLVRLRISLESTCGIDCITLSEHVVRSISDHLEVWGLI
jgi:hypothetical protein